MSPGIQQTRPINMTNIKSKGSELGKLLDDAEVIHTQMRTLFLKNGLTTIDLTALKKISEEDYNQWRELHTASNALGKKMCEVVNPVSSEA